MEMTLARSLSLFVVLLTLALPGCATKTFRIGDRVVPEKEVLPFVGTYQANRFTLSNGLRLIVVEDHSSPTFSYQTWFRVGSRNEQVNYTGLAHLFEHMMFKETKNHKDGEFDRLLEGAGAEGENAFTSRDYTAYIQELPKNQLELIASLESDRMINLVVNEKAFKTETEVVQNERRYRTENSPDGTMYQELFATAFTRHPYRWPVIGFQEDLARMSAKDAEAFYQKYYRPSYATIVVAGDVDPDDVFSTVKKYYGSIASEPFQEATVEEEPRQSSPRRKQLKLAIQVEKLMMGYRIPGVFQADEPALEILRLILTGGKSSRLNRALVDTGIASSVEAWELEDKDPSLFVIVANLQVGKRAAQAETIILKELARLENDPSLAQEIEQVKNRINFGFYEQLNSNTDKTRFIGQYETMIGDFQLGLRRQEKVLATAPADVQNAIHNHFNPNNRTVITGMPK
jgi:zinc protease